MTKKSIAGVTHHSQARPKSAAYFERGIQGFLSATTAVMADVAASRITPKVGNAIFARQRNALKMLELQLKTGQAVRVMGPRTRNKTTLLKDA
jgi:hypothetical protein